MEMHRNTRCWCGSGKKYKQCHEKFDEKLAKLAREGHIVPDRSLIKNKEDIIGIKKSGNINTGWTRIFPLTSQTRRKTILS